MQITFDPLVPAEAEYVRKIMGAEILTLTVGEVSAELTATQMADLLRAGIKVAEADRPDVGADAPSAAPLPPDAPLPAAADLFSTVPVAPPAGEANAPIVPAPPVPSAPPVAVPPAPASPAPRAENGDLDKDGLPWDARIHSGSREKNKDGTWRQRRNLPEGTKETVEKELRALMALPTPGVTLGGPNETAALEPLVPTPPAPPVSAAPLPSAVNAAPTAVATANSTNTTADAQAGARTVTAPVEPTEIPNVPPPPVPVPPTSAPATAPIPTPPVPPAPTAAATGAPVTFADIMKKITKLISERTITEEVVHKALESVGLTSGQIGLLAARSDLIPGVNAHIDEAIRA